MAQVKRSLLKTLLLIVLLMLAIVLGKLIGVVTAGVPFLSWLGMSASFGFPSVPIDLSVLELTFGVMVNTNVAQALLLLAAILIYSAVRIHD